MSGEQFVWLLEIAFLAGLAIPVFLGGISIGFAITVGIPAWLIIKWLDRPPSFVSKRVEWAFRYPRKGKNN